MRPAPLSLVAASFAILTIGCQRAPCQTMDGKEPPLTVLPPPYAKLLGTLPTGLVACFASPSDPTTLNTDFDPEPANPFVSLTEELEKRGFRRVRQDISKPQSMTAEFETDAVQLRVNMAQIKKRTQALLTVAGTACGGLYGVRTKSTCVGTKVVTCDRQSWPQTETDCGAVGCVSSGRGPDATAQCKTVEVEPAPALPASGQ